MKNIVIVGFMGTGKTAVARLIAQNLNKRFINIDAMIEKKSRMSINDIWKKKGESYFRGLERKIIAGLSKRRDAVIDAGGGAVIDESNVKGLKANGVIFCLNAAPEIILRRTEKYTHRPLLNVPDPLAEIKKLLKKRKNYYKKADYQIDTSAKSVDEVSREIIKKWNTGAKEDRNQK